MLAPGFEKEEMYLKDCLSWSEKEFYLSLCRIARAFTSGFLIKMKSSGSVMSMITKSSWEPFIPDYIFLVWDHGRYITFGISSFWWIEDLVLNCFQEFGFDENWAAFYRMIVLFIMHLSVTTFLKMDLDNMSSILFIEI